MCQTENEIQLVTWCCAQDIAKELKELGSEELRSVFDAVTERFIDFKEARFSVTGKIDSKKHPVCAHRNYKDNGFGFDCDGSKHVYGNEYTHTTASTPEAVLRLYGLLWSSSLELPPEKEGRKLHDGSGDRTKYFALKATDPDCKNLRIGGDTMNSFTTTNSTVKKYLINGKGEKLKEMKECQRLLAYLTHTLGNFIPVPISEGESFNKNRSRETRDYWDLTLECIRDWYNKKDKNFPLHGTLNGEENRAWFSQFREKSENKDKGKVSWEVFIDKNFLRCYVNDEYQVKSLFGAASPRDRLKGDSGNVMPSSEEEVLECLINMCSCIIARGNQMELKIKRKDDRKYFFRDGAGKPSTSKQPD